MGLFGISSDLGRALVSERSWFLFRVGVRPGWSWKSSSQLEVVHLEG